MKINFLGTGTSQGIPIISCSCEVCTSNNPKDTRLRTSIFIEDFQPNFNVLIDVGPDFRQQMLVNKITKIDCILLTHEHADHTAGMDDLRPFTYIHKNEIPIFALPRVIGELKKRFDYIFGADPYPGAPVLRLYPIDFGEKFEIGGRSVEAIPIIHGNLDIVGFRFGDSCYITDASKIDQEVTKQLQGLRILILNALRHKPHPAHLSLSEAMEYVDIIKPEICYLTHISHEMGLHQYTESTLPPHIRLAYDNLVIS